MKMKDRTCRKLAVLCFQQDSFQKSGELFKGPRDFVALYYCIVRYVQKIKGLVGGEKIVYPMCLQQRLPPFVSPFMHDSSQWKNCCGKVERTFMAKQNWANC